MSDRVKDPLDKPTKVLSKAEVEMWGRAQGKGVYYETAMALGRALKALVKINLKTWPSIEDERAAQQALNAIPNDWTENDNE